MISAKIIKDSISPTGKRIITYELEYPRFIHSELMTHRAFSRNAASSRAIPISTMLRLVWNNPATPIHWGKYQSGMSAKEELTGFRLWISKKLWNVSGKVACVFAWSMWKAGLAKQVVNRIVEPWSHIKVVVTATDYDNWEHLRRHPAAQPEIHRLADEMFIEKEKSFSTLMNYGEWHLPYVTRIAHPHFDDIMYHAKPIGTDVVYNKENLFNLETAKRVSASLCAQVSYRKSDESIDKALRIYDTLVNNKPVHASPFEHQATPLKDPNESSGNFKGWLQYRQLIKDNVYIK